MIVNYPVYFCERTRNSWKGGEREKKGWNDGTNRNVLVTKRKKLSTQSRKKIQKERSITFVVIKLCDSPLDTIYKRENDKTKTHTHSQID